MCHKLKDPPAAIFDAKGNLLTTDKDIEERALEVFTNRLKGNDMKEDLKELEVDTNKLCKERLKLCKNKKTKPWDLEDLKLVLKDLTKNKSRDSDGYANELFMLDVAGEDLKLAVLNLCNLIKERQVFPEALQNWNITPLHKKKSRKDLKNYRGIFRVPILRSILDCLLYIDCYEVIDSNLTDDNVGAREERSCRDNN